MSPVPKSPFNQEESSSKDDSKNFTGVNFGGGINLEVPINEQNHNGKSKSQYIKDNKSDPLAE